MAPSQTTRSPRRLRKQEERAEKKFKSANINYEQEQLIQQRYDYWLDVVIKQRPDLTKTGQEELAMNIALRNRTARRAHGMQ